MRHLINKREKVAKSRPSSNTDVEATTVPPSAHKKYVSYSNLLSSKLKLGMTTELKTSMKAQTATAEFNKISTECVCCLVV